MGVSRMRKQTQCARAAAVHLPGESLHRDSRAYENKPSILPQKHPHTATPLDFHSLPYSITRMEQTNRALITSCAYTSSLKITFFKSALSGKEEWREWRRQSTSLTPSIARERRDRMESGGTRKWTSSMEKHCGFVLPQAILSFIYPHPFAGQSTGGAHSQGHLYSA